MKESDGQIRKEVRLPIGTVEHLNAFAKAEGRSVKNYMEVVLMIHVQEKRAKPKKKSK